MSQFKHKLTKTRIIELTALGLAEALDGIRKAAPQPLSPLDALAEYSELHPFVDPDDIGIAVKLDEALFRAIQDEAFDAKLIKEKAPPEFASTCPHCGASGSGMVMARWHGDRCRRKPTEAPPDASIELRLQHPRATKAIPTACSRVPSAAITKAIGTDATGAR